MGLALTMIRSRSTRPDSFRLCLPAWVPALFAVGLCLAPQVAQATTPTPEEFTIQYFQDDDGDRGPRLVSRDFQTQFNLAQCQCGKSVRVLLQRRRGKNWEPGIMEIRVGRNCDRGAQLTNGGAGQYRPCLLLQRMTNPQGDFERDVEVTIPMYWFSSGVSDVDHELLSDPATTPHRQCPQITGESGIWMCFGQDKCLDGQFFLRPTAQPQANPADPASASKTPGTNTVDYPLLDLVPPADSPNLVPGTSPADSAVQLNWDLPSDANVVGYRVLCRPKNAANAAWRHPEATKAIEQFTGNRQLLQSGTIYSLPQYLGLTCEPPRNESLDATLPQLVEPSSVVAPMQAPPQESNTTTGASDSTSSSTATSSESTAGQSTQDKSSSAPAQGIDPLLANRDWAQLCTGHVPGTTRSVRVGGLQNDQPYLFQLIAYDAAGNSSLVGTTVEASPTATIDYWEACTEGNTNRCGKLGYCALDDQGGPSSLWCLFLLLFGIRPRKDSTCS